MDWPTVMKSPRNFVAEQWMEIMRVPFSQLDVPEAFVVWTVIHKAQRQGHPFGFKPLPGSRKTSVSVKNTPTKGTEWKRKDPLPVDWAFNDDLAMSDGSQATTPTTPMRRARAALITQPSLSDVIEDPEETDKVNDTPKVPTPHPYRQDALGLLSASADPEVNHSTYSLQARSDGNVFPIHASTTQSAPAWSDAPPAEPSSAHWDDSATTAYDTQIIHNPTADALHAANAPPAEPSSAHTTTAYNTQIIHNPTADTLHAANAPPAEPSSAHWDDSATTAYDTQVVHNPTSKALATVNALGQAVHASPYRQSELANWNGEMPLRPASVPNGTTSPTPCMEQLVHSNCSAVMAPAVPNVCYGGVPHPTDDLVHWQPTVVDGGHARSTTPSVYSSRQPPDLGEHHHVIDPRTLQSTSIGSQWNGRVDMRSMPYGFMWSPHPDMFRHSMEWANVDGGAGVGTAISSTALSGGMPSWGYGYAPTFSSAPLAVTAPTAITPHTSSQASVTDSTYTGPPSAAPTSFTVYGTHTSTPRTSVVEPAPSVVLPRDQMTGNHDSRAMGSGESNAPIDSLQPGASTSKSMKRKSSQRPTQPCRQSARIIAARAGETTHSAGSSLSQPLLDNASSTIAERPTKRPRKALDGKAKGGEDNLVTNDDCTISSGSERVGVGHRGRGRGRNGRGRGRKGGP